MNYERINELENFSNEFNKKLEEAYKNYEENLEKEETALYNSPKKAIKEKKKKHFTENIFKDPPAWKPSNYYTKDFGSFNKLENKYEMNDWELRSFEKEKELPQHKNFAYARTRGTDFGESKDLSKLSGLGQSIISKFMKENELKEITLKKKEEEIEKYKHMKPQVVINPWMSANHIITEFSKPIGDKVVFYRKEPKRKFLIQEPFRRPKRDGEFFESGVKLI